KVTEMAKALPIKVLRAEDFLNEDPVPDDLPELTRGDDDVAVLMYTSGTTGTPKGVMLTHTNLIENYKSVIDVYPFTKEHTFVCVLPLFHSFGMLAMMLLPIQLGSRTILVPQFQPQKLAEIFNTYTRCIFFGVAPMFQVLGLLAKSKGLKYEKLELCVSGAAALPNDVKNIFEDATGIDLFQGYGLSEASPVVSLNLPNQHKPGTIGKTIRGVEVQIWDDEGNRQPNGEIGEIMVKGQNVMKGYYKNPDVTAQTITDGWLHTGDLGRLDDDGYTTIVGRKKELIISAGENIYPLEIEDVLTSHPAVKEAAVIGVPHPTRGEDAKAYVALHEGAEVEIAELKQLCKDKLAAFKVPAEFEIREELPKSPTGKILKRVLQSELAKG
ncbi:MAG: AMP-binding protein, partial [Candidatus Omnitrophica bacterium]|nr:AMP-binding protein [Candidatus Omnitrophota bacterium]